MIVKEILHVTADEFYHFLQEMAIQDIKEATGKTVSIKDVKAGYRYKKSLKTKTGQTGSVKTEITSLTPQYYSVQFKSAQGLNQLSYSYQPLDHSSITCTYEEAFIGKSTVMDLNYKIMSVFYKRSNKKKAQLMLKQIEQIITDQRKSA